MGKITVETCGIEGLKIITPAVFGDERGYFYESYHYEAYKEAGISEVFVQDNQSSGRRGVLRGLHFQKQFPQDKLVRAIRGEGYLVLSDYAEFCYKCTDFYHPGDEGGIAYDDPAIGIEWPIPEDMELIMIERDTKWGGLDSYKR